MKNVHFGFPMLFKNRKVDRSKINEYSSLETAVYGFPFALCLLFLIYIETLHLVGGFIIICIYIFVYWVKTRQDYILKWMDEKEKEKENRETD